MKITYGIVLVTLDKKILAAHPTRHAWNQWDIIKGCGNEGEDPFAALCREFFEETGFVLEHICNKIIDITDLKKNKLYFYNHKKKALHGFVGFLKQPIDISEFKCSSMVESFGALPPFPEIDSFCYINLSDIEVLHSTQQEFIRDLIQYGYFDGVDPKNKLPKSDFYG